MSLSRQVAQNTIIQVSGKIVGTFLGVAAAFFLMRYLGDEKYGEYTTIMTYLQIFGILMDLGLFIILVKRISQPISVSEQNVIINNTFSFRLVTGISLLLVAIVISWFIPQYNLVIKWGIIITAINFLFISLNQLLTAIYQKHLAMTKVALAEIFGKIFLFGSTLSVIYIFKAGLLAVCGTVVLGGVVNFTILLLGTYKYYRIHLAWDKKLWLALWKESWPIAVCITFNTLYFKADTLILGWLKTQRDVGIYGAPYKMLEVIITIPAIFVGLVMPVLSENFSRKNWEHFNYLLQKSFDALCMIALPIIAGTLLLAQPIMLLIAGREFTADPQVLGRLLQILIIAVGSIFIGTLFGYLVVVVDKQKVIIKAYVFTAITALIGYFFMIYWFSYYGAAIITVYSEICMLLFSAITVYRAVKFKLSIKIFIRILAASLAMMLVIYLLPQWHVLILISLGGLVYLFFLYIFKGISGREIKEIISLQKHA